MYLSGVTGSKIIRTTDIQYVQQSQYENTPKLVKLTGVPNIAISCQVFGEPSDFFTNCVQHS